MKHSHILKLKQSFGIVLCLIVGLGSGSSAHACSQKGIATTTMYYLPNMESFGCTSLNEKSQACRDFRAAVDLQGSGRIPGNKILRYNGKISSMGDCPTTKGADATCLIPFISVAADLSLYNPGDIIEMPALKGKKFPLLNGGTFTHPGYFIVSDTGGAIKGKGRFDFFSGFFGIRNKKNPFGYKGASDTRMYSKTTCDSHKAYKHYPKDSRQAEYAVAAIENALGGTAYEDIVITIGQGGQY